MQMTMSMRLLESLEVRCWRKLAASATVSMMVADAIYLP